jgi:hypothetical protein
MLTTLEVEKETAEKLSRLAAARNVSIDDLLAAYIPALQNETKASSTEDTLSAFENWASSFETAAPPLSDEAVSRAAIYSDH